MRTLNANNYDIPTAHAKKRSKFEPLPELLTVFFDFQEIGEQNTRLFPTRKNSPTESLSSSPFMSDTETSFTSDEEEIGSLGNESDSGLCLSPKVSIQREIEFGIDDLAIDDLNDCYFECYEYQMEEEEIFHKNFQIQNEYIFTLEEEWESNLFLSNTASFEPNWVRKTKKNKKEKSNKLFISHIADMKFTKKQTNKLLHYSEGRPYTPYGFHRGESQSNTSTSNPIRSQTSPSKKEQDDLNKAIKASLESISLTGNVAQQILSLQNRDITPEDYDLLLLLDASVPKKTVSKKELNKLNIRTLCANDPICNSESHICGVCMSEYLVGESIKTLPCSHLFHSECIDQWLSGSSVKCPIDGKEIC